jgi:hypothetical protein
MSLDDKFDESEFVINVLSKVLNKLIDTNEKVYM